MSSTPEQCKQYHKKNKKRILSRKKEYYKNNREQILKNHKEKRKTGVYEWRKRLYGITAEDYQKMFTKQKGCCAICGKHQSEEKHALCVDHNHQTKKIRGLLCKTCNHYLGILEDKKFIKKAHKYLKAS